MPFPPNLFLIGAQKAGTTYLANLLDQHDEVCVSDPKEPAYLTRNMDRGLDWYRSRFSNPEAAYLLDATTGYSSSPLTFGDASPQASRFLGVPGRLKDLCPDALLLYVVRDPVGRTYSAYWHNVRAGHESRPFRDAIEEDSYYLRTSRYFDQLALYREHFARERILVLKFEELVRDPVDTVSRCFAFLSLDPPTSIDTDSGQNRSFTYPPVLSHVNRALSRYGGVGRITKAARDFMPDRLKNWLYDSVARKIPPISREDAEYIARYFRDCNERLSIEYGVNIEEWRK